MEKEQTFAEQLSRLEKIIAELDKGDLPIEKMLNLYEEGMLLTQALHKFLEEAELKVEEIATKVSGRREE
jgi:exodeoxyribonuclease VII small subunit